MKLDLVPVRPRVLAVRVIPDVEPQLAAQLALQDEQRALGLITCTSDDALYAALDEGTKAAPVEVVYAKSFYAGSNYASGPLSGEILGIYAAADPDQIQAALAACVAYLEHEAWFYAADEAGKLAFFPHVISALGGYLSLQAGLAPGQPMAYLIAPPIESILGLDAALKAAPVRLCKWFGPPTETNYGGGYLAGALPEVEAAARAFAAAVVETARHPQAAARPVRAAGETLEARPPGPGPGAGRFRVLQTGQRLALKPEHLTHLSGDEDLVPKTHPRIALRGQLEQLEAALLDAQVAASDAGARALVGELGEALELVRALVGAEVTGRPAPSPNLLGLDAAGIRHASHHTWELYRVPFMVPDVRQGAVVSRLNLARARARAAELAALHAFGRGLDPPEREDLVLALNRLSSALYIMTCKYVGGRYDEGRKPAGPVRGWRPPG
ncbi:MAG TPA: ethanolamine utilization microcompartment protein EutL [Polyangia bacterium]|nr:ethanolamine utilization microcompartment protein EutL [Polyangia bacterium]